MLNRKQKIEELMEGLQSFRRTMIFHGIPSAKMPRVTPSQWIVLHFVAQRGENSIKDVAHALNITSSAATQLVDGLVRSGYMIREIDSKDRRLVMLTLSKKTKNQVERMKKEALQKFLNIFKVLNNKEFDQYYALNKKIVQRLLNKKSL